MNENIKSNDNENFRQQKKLQNAATKPTNYKTNIGPRIFLKENFSFLRRKVLGKIVKTFAVSCPRRIKSVLKVSETLGRLNS